MAQMLTLPLVFTLEEVANYLKLTPETVERLAKNGKIPGRNIENSWRFLRSAIDMWLTGKPDLPVLDNTQIVEDVRQLPPLDKIKLMRILAEDLEQVEDISPLTKHKTYTLATPYNTFGVGQALMDAMTLNKGG